MKLSPMRYKDYVWPHNPRTYGIDYRRAAAVHKVPFGRYFLQDMGLFNRVLKGEGEFAGEGAYAEFKKLAAVFYDDGPGLLIHPLWTGSNALFVELSLLQEPTEDYVKYAFEFWECYDGYATSAEAMASEPDAAGTGGGAALYYTAVYGDCLWNIAIANGLSLEALLALNPQIKNPNLLYPGDVIRVA